MEGLLDWILTPAEQAERRRRESHWTDFLEPDVDESLGWLDDTGLLVADGPVVRLTPVGDIFVAAWVDHLQG